MRYAVVQFAKRIAIVIKETRTNLWTGGQSWAGRCLLKLRAIDTERISDNTKTTRPRGGKRPVHERNETRTNIFFVVTRTLYHSARHHHRSSPTAPSSSNIHGRRSTREFDTFPSYEKRAESIFSHFFSPPQNQRPAVTQTRYHPSRAFHFVLTVRTFAALSSPSSFLALSTPSVRTFLFASVYFTPPHLLL